jgi:hypothetical protein
MNFFEKRIPKSIIFIGARKEVQENNAYNHLMVDTVSGLDFQTKKNRFKILE